MKRITFAAALALAFGAGLTAHTIAGAKQPPVSAKTVLESDLKGGVFEQGLMQVYAFEPGAALPWHIHPDAHEFAYILDGTLTLEVEGEGIRTVKTGEGVHLNPNVVHRGTADAVAGTKLVVVRLKPKDKPAVTLIQR